MENDIVIRAAGLGKKYIIGHEVERDATLRDTMTRTASRLVRSISDMIHGRALIDGDSLEEFWALRDIGFEVSRGDVLGVIGRNGAGKSTLLKILSRITEPTEGRVEIDGRISSLLEVGTGFHPELTGRENIFLNGAILGMTRAEIRSKFDEIVDFAGVERFLDTPVKRYSSGMYVRLAFAVAAHLEPEILIVDEVLAVGDTEFQEKCLGKMRNVAREGRTVIFVSHNLSAIKTLCASCMFLSNGSVEATGPTDDVVTAYLDSIFSGTSDEGLIRWDSAGAPGDDDFRLREVKVAGLASGIPGVATVDEAVAFSCTYEQSSQVRGARLVLQVITSTGELAFASTDHSVHLAAEKAQSGAATFRSSCVIPANLLNAGSYLLRLRVGMPGERVLIPDCDLLGLRVDGKTSHGSEFDSKWPGAVCPKLEWQVERLS